MNRMVEIKVFFFLFEGKVYLNGPINFFNLLGSFCQIVKKKFFRLPISIQ